MPLRESRLTSQKETDDCCPREPRAPGDKLADALQSQIINAFEAAIYQGRPGKTVVVVEAPGYSVAIAGSCPISARRR